MLYSFFCHHSHTLFDLILYWHYFSLQIRDFNRPIMIIITFLQDHNQELYQGYRTLIDRTNADSLIFWKNLIKVMQVA